jgi:hypothetical protein
MTSTEVHKKRRLPKVLSILFGSSLVALAMATVSGTAQAGIDCYGCNMCKWSSVGFYCFDSSPGTECCKSDWHQGQNSCSTYGAWCS